MKKLFIGLLCLWVVILLMLKTGYADFIAETFLGRHVQSVEDIADRVVFLQDVPEYYYDQLNPQEQVWYRNIRDILGAMADKTKLDGRVLGAGCDEDSIEKIFQAVMNDHPELFYLEGYTYTKSLRGLKVVAISFRGDYTMPREEALQTKETIESAAERWIANLTEKRDQYSKVKKIYEDIILNTNYDMDAPENQNIYSVLVNHHSVCQGYAKTVQYLCNQIGIECILVQGKVDTGDTHAWNCVKIDGSYYLLDTTWGDASYQLKSSEMRVDIPDINYDYLNITSAEMERTHTADARFQLPQCTATAANYYQRRGALFSSYDEAALQRFFAEHSMGKDGLSLKCETESCFREMKRALIERQEIFKYLTGGDQSVAYTSNDNQLTLTFWMTSN